MRSAAFLVLVVWAGAALAPSAAAQAPEVWFYQGGEPGVTILVAGSPIANASSPGAAIRVDPGEPLRLSISIAPPPETRWEVRSISVGMLVRGPGTQAPESLVRRVNATATLPPGFTVVVNRTIELGPVAKLGAGTFLMEATVQDENGTALFAQTFYVRVPATAASILTVQGATITAISAATGYGLWQVAKDIKELRDAWARHRKRAEQARLDVIGRAEHVVEETVSKVGKPLAGAVALHRAAEARERTWAPVRWAATGLGLGGVAMAWMQFLGYFALDVTGLLITAVEVCAAFLTLALVANALLRRGKPPAPDPELARSIPIQDASAPVDASEVVHPPHKRD